MEKRPRPREAALASRFITENLAFSKSLRILALCSRPYPMATTVILSLPPASWRRPQTADGLFRTCGLYDGVYIIGLYHVGQTVRTDNQRSLIGKWEIQRVALHCLLHAQGPGDEVLARMVLGFALGELALFEHGLYDGMVAGHLLDAPVRHQIGAAVPHMADMRPSPVTMAATTVVPIPRNSKSAIAVSYISTLAAATALSKR